MDKMYLCKWGDWDNNAMNSYEPDTKEVSEDFFTENNGYNKEEIEAVTALGIGEQYNVTYGNHTIVRIR